MNELILVKSHNTSPPLQSLSFSDISARLPLETFLGVELMRWCQVPLAAPLQFLADKFNPTFGVGLIYPPPVEKEV